MPALAVSIESMPYIVGALLVAGLLLFFRFARGHDTLVRLHNEVVRAWTILEEELGNRWELSGQLLELATEHGVGDEALRAQIAALSDEQEGAPKSESPNKRLAREQAIGPALAQLREAAGGDERFAGLFGELDAVHAEIAKDAPIHNEHVEAFNAQLLADTERADKMGLLPGLRFELEPASSAD